MGKNWVILEENCLFFTPSEGKISKEVTHHRCWDAQKSTHHRCKLIQKPTHKGCTSVVTRSMGVPPPPQGFSLFSSDLKCLTMHVYFIDRVAPQDSLGKIIFCQKSWQNVFMALIYIFLNSIIIWKV